MSEASRLSLFPVNLFGSIMGFSGLTLCFKKLHDIFDVSEYFYLVLALLTSIFFTAITVTYLAKLIKHPSAVIKEFEHPVTLNFFPTFSISLILMSLIFKDLSFDAAQIMWSLGAFIQFALLLYILGNWIHQDKWHIIDMSPAWFIPIVGTIVIPLGAIHFGTVEIGWFFFSIGLVFWVLLNSIVMYRLFFHSPMVQLLEPTLFILIAPPAVGFISYMSLGGMAGVDELARILYYIGLFLTIFLLSQVSRFVKVPFALSWWAYSFPLAAITLATLIMFEQLEIMLFKYIAIFLLTILSAVVVHLTAMTLWAIKCKALCVPPHIPIKTTAEEIDSSKISEK